MFEIKIMCIAMVMFCETPPKSEVFDTLVECDQALLRVVAMWRPVKDNHAYTYNCRRK